MCVFKTNLSLFELFPKTLGIWEPFKRQLMSCRTVGWRYDFMMLQIMLERHSDSQIPRNTIGGKQGNAVTVPVSQMILSALECCGLTGRDSVLLLACFPRSSTLQITSLDWIEKAVHSASKMPEECSICTGQRVGFLTKGQWMCISVLANGCPGLCPQ